LRILSKESYGEILIKPTRFGDHRGFFSETYSQKKYADFGIDLDFVQDNHSLSADIGTLRGLHFQRPPKAQAKLVRCGRGAIFDVVVDIRKDSPSFGCWQGYELTANNGWQLFVPIGFAHGFVTLKKNSEIVYKCSDYYDPETEGSVSWEDPDIGINWKLKGDPIISTKDREAPLLRDLESPFFYRVNS